MNARATPVGTILVWHTFTQPTSHTSWNRTSVTRIHATLCYTLLHIPSYWDTFVHGVVTVITSSMFFTSLYDVFDERIISAALLWLLGYGYTCGMRRQFPFNHWSHVCLFQLTNFFIFCYIIWYFIISFGKKNLTDHL